MGHIKRSHLSEAIVLIPPRKILNEIDGLFRLNLEKQIANSIEISRLSINRDTLLPKLINGEIDV
jgi:type I restriction enzyme S subunit